MKKTTPTINRIFPYAHILGSVIRSIWYIRTILLTLVVIIAITSLLLFITEHNISQVNEIRPVSTFLESVYFNFAVAISVNTGNIGVFTNTGRILLIVDRSIGLILIGIVVWIVQYCIGEEKLKISKFIFFDSSEDAKI